MIARIQVRRGTTAEWAAAAPVVLAAGEPGYDSTLKKTKVGDGTTAWSALPWITNIGTVADLPVFTTTDGALTVKTIQQAATLLGMTGKNILHNWDFRLNPVNQRASSGAISSGYFYDRWMRYAGTITINSTYLSMPADASIEQRIEGLGLSGKAVTVSILLGGAVISGTGTFPTSAGTSAVTLTGFGTATLGYHADYMFIRITATDSTRNLQAVKLETGLVSTLKFDPPMDYGAELIKCMRFYQALGNYPIGYGYAYATTGGVFTLPLPVKMRVNPTLSSNTCTARQNGYDIVTTLTFDTMAPNGHLRYIAAPTGSYQAAAAFTANFGTAMSISADL